MKRFRATFWRSNPEFLYGGYRTRRTIEAEDIATARERAEHIANSYYADGTLTLQDVEFIGDAEDEN